MKTLNEIRDILARHKKDVCKNYKVKRIGIFGSYVRNEEEGKSDIDILVDFEENADLFDLTGLALFLEEKLNQKVDIIPRRVLRKEIRGRVLKEVVTV